MAGRLMLVFALTGALAFATGAVAAKPLTVSQFRTQANATCTSAYKQIAGLSGSDLAVYLGDVLPLIRNFEASIARLSPPATFAVPFGKLITTLTAERAYLQKLYTRAKTGHLTVSQFQNDTTMASLSHTEDSLWSQMGVTVCAS